TLLELTRAYAVFPNRGRRVEPVFIRRVLDRNGQVLIDNVVLGSDPVVIPPPGEEPEAEILDEPTDAARIAGAADPEDASLALDPDQLVPVEDAFLMTDMLRAVVQEGTGFRLKALGRPLGGKTGTTNDQADAWFVGFSPDIATGVWVGHDSHHKLGFGETGSRAAAPIWVDYMRVALADRPIRDFLAPDSIIYTRIDKKTGLLADPTSHETLFQAFIAGTEPTTRAETQRNTDDALRDLREEGFGVDSDDMLMMQLDSF
ncbi:MAG: penicillin-binding transpeptidase domain-containing protein, partial [Gemmatimonadota bacterium]|nr:penicillin-binding transpeptidase domain-containing protein [Gemmatimonadota bacterium]